MDLPELSDHFDEANGGNRREGERRFPVVGVGASSGGIEAFTQLISNLPADSGMAFVLVLHLDPTHESALPRIFGRATSLPVVEARDGLKVEPNHIYIISPNSSLTLRSGVLVAGERLIAEGSLRTIDVFFESLARDRGRWAIGIVLSGTASDGTLGLEAIKADGGITFAQDESAAQCSMPRSAISTGCVDFVLSPRQMAAELVRIAKHPVILSPEEETDDEKKGEPVKGSGKQRFSEEGFKRIVFLLKRQSGVDFSLYKPNTIRRRVNRRMVLNKINTIEDYADLLLGNDRELAALASDALINVTAFFRDPQAFQVLQESVFPKILQSGSDAPVRIWVAACSTGQEAYSIAMALTETADRLNQVPKIQIFATDVNEEVLIKARHALYPKSLIQDISPERLARFFVLEDGGYRVKKTLREMFVFARQNLAGDPPFSRLDLITCRNLMIYLEGSLQRKVVPVFHYALKPNGFLFLGSSETVGAFGDLFQVVDKKHKIYTKLGVPTPSLRLAFDTTAAVDRVHPKPTIPILRLEPALTPQREADRVALNRRAPPALLIDDDYQVLQFRGDTSSFLKIQEGTATHHALEIVRNGLVDPLKKAVEEARPERKPVRLENLSLVSDSVSMTLNLEVTPLKNLRTLCFLIEFENTTAGMSYLPPRGYFPRQAAREGEGQSAVGTNLGDENELLRAELEELRDFARAHQEQQEATTEELQTSNEEIQSSNEELQSINEELETAKEELESANEELNTVNEEMVNRNAELNRLNSDLNNLQNSINTAVVLLSCDLCIRSFTTPAQTEFNLLDGDVGRPFAHIQHNLVCPDLEELLVSVMKTGTAYEREVQDKSGHWYSLRMRPYLTLSNRIDGVVLILVDVDLLKRSEQAILESRNYVENILHSTRYPLLVLDEDLRVHSANAAFLKSCRVSTPNIAGRYLYELNDGAWSSPHVITMVTDVLRRNAPFDDLEVSHDFPQIGFRTMLLNGRRLHGSSVEHPDRVLLAVDDITNSRQLEAVQISEIRFRRLFEAAKDGIIILDPGTGRIKDANPFVIDLVGKDKAGMLDRQLWEVGIFADHAANQSALLALREHGYYRDQELSVVNANGETRSIEIICNVYEEGNHRVIQVNIRDTTERRQTEQMARAALERFRFLAEKVPQKIFTARPNGEVDYVNEQWTKYTRMTIEQLGSWGWLPLVHLDDVKLTLERWNHSIATGADFQVEHRFRAFDGTYRWHLSRVSAMRGEQGEILIWVGSNTDIDDQKLSSERLEQTVTERTARLTEIIGELESFSYSVSHDLRAPLRSIQSFAGLLIEDCGDKVGETGRQHLTRITSAAHRMDALIQDILSFSLVARAQLPLRSINLASLVAGVVESYPNLQGKDARISITGDIPEVIGNEAAITQCVSNLLGNAVKFVAIGKTPTVTIWAEPRGRRIRLWVEDNGIGIDPEAREKIFGIFQRISKKYEGTGIGLAIVKKAVERMGGSVGVDSIPGQGSKFWIELLAANRP